MTDDEIIETIVRWVDADMPTVLRQAAKRINRLPVEDDRKIRALSVYMLGLSERLILREATTLASDDPGATGSRAASSVEQIRLALASRFAGGRA